MIEKEMLIVKLIVILGALNWGLLGLNIDTGVYITKYTSPQVERIIYIIIGVAALYLLTKRDFFLPFLGSSAYPCGSLLLRVPDNANTKITVKVEPNVNVIYWASESNSQVQPDPVTAYGTTANAGVARSDASGNAVLLFRYPSAYVVRGQTLPIHVHYRVCKKPGMVGIVQTVKLSSDITSSIGTSIPTLQSPSV